MDSLSLERVTLVFTLSLSVVCCVLNGFFMVRGLRARDEKVLSIYNAIMFSLFLYWLVMLSVVISCSHHLIAHVSVDESIATTTNGVWFVADVSFGYLYGWAASFMNGVLLLRIHTVIGVVPFVESPANIYKWLTIIVICSISGTVSATLHIVDNSKYELAAHLISLVYCIILVGVSYHLLREFTTTLRNFMVRCESTTEESGSDFRNYLARTRILGLTALWSTVACLVTLVSISVGETLIFGVHETPSAFYMQQAVSLIDCSVSSSCMTLWMTYNRSAYNRLCGRTHKRHMMKVMRLIELQRTQEMNRSISAVSQPYRPAQASAVVEMQVGGAVGGADKAQLSEKDPPVPGLSN